MNLPCCPLTMRPILGLTILSIFHNLNPNVMKSESKSVFLAYYQHDSRKLMIRPSGISNSFIVIDGMHADLLHQENKGNEEFCCAPTGHGASKMKDGTDKARFME
jgi:hypothetical protein